MNRSRKMSHAARAFSMLELTFVLVVIGVLLAVAAFNFQAFADRARARATKTTMSTIKAAIGMYYGENNTYPATVQSLQPGFLSVDTPVKDGWKRDFIYMFDASSQDPARPYTLRSVGADGISNTQDDIDVWTMNQ